MQKPQLKLCVRAETEICIHTLFAGFIKLLICLVLFYNP